MTVCVTHWTEYGELGLSIDGKSYSYFGVEAWHRKRINKYIRLGLKGKLMGYMRGFARPDLYEREG